MNAKKWAARLVPIALCCALTALAFILLYEAAARPRRDARAPGVRADERTLLVVWMAGDPLDAGAWMRGEAGAYEKANPGVRVWVRAASREELDALARTDEGAPDVLVFSLGTAVEQSCLRPLCLDLPLGERALAAGRADGAQYAVPVCLAGYALAVRTQEAALTRAPASLLGVSPAPSRAQASPAPARVSMPEEIAADDGFGALALSLLNTGARPRLLPKDTLLSAFEEGKAQGALLSTRELAKCRAGYAALDAAPATDSALFAAAARTGGAHAERFIAHLLAEAGQRALADAALLSARCDVWLYGSEFPAHALCERVPEGLRLPNAFTWPVHCADTLCQAQALCLAGVSAAALPLD